MSTILCTRFHCYSFRGYGDFDAAGAHLYDDSFTVIFSATEPKPYQHTGNKMQITKRLTLVEQHSIGSTILQNTLLYALFIMIEKVLFKRVRKLSFAN